MEIIENFFKSSSLPNNFTNEEPPKTGQYLVYVQDYFKKDFMILYWREDTKKFYMHPDCFKEKSVEDFWKIKPIYWILLQEMNINEFEKEDN